MMGSSAAGAYEIERSLRFDKTIDQNLQFTPSSNGDRRTWTFSCWLKRSVVGGGSQAFFRCREGSYPKGLVMARFLNDELDILRWNGASAAWQVQTNRLFRDPSSWYHIVIAYDTTQGTAANRVKLYVNGTQETDLGEDDYPNQNSDYEINTQFPHEVGVASFDGYLADVNFIDGQQLTPSSFGETNADTGQWRPIKYEGTYGTNGFFLEFKDNSAATAAAIGKDTSGNGNNFTPSDISVTAGVGNDSFEDTPTNNFCTLNPAIGNDGKSGATPDNGALDVAGTDESTNRATFIFGPGHITSGKWYWEVTSTGGANGQRIGLSGDLWGSQGGNSVWFRGGDVSWCSANAYKKYTSNSETADGSYSSGDVIGVAYSADDDEVKYYRNGTLTLTDDTLPSVATTELHIAIHASNTGSNNWPVGSLNFGQRAFAQTPPTGYKKLCTANLPTPTIKKGSDHFNTLLYTGTATGSGTQTISGLDFSPDFVWIKNRGVAYSHMLVDTVRGAGNWMESNSSNAEESGNANGNLTSFTSDGFVTTRGSSNGGRVNENNDTYVSWNWKGSDSAAAANTDGTIDSTVSVNATAGFSVGTFSGTGANGTIGHGLGVAPKFILIKSRENNNSWAVYHHTIGADIQLLFNSTNATTADTTGFTEVPTSTVINVGSGAAMDTNKSGGAASHVFYAFSEVEGYSKFGKYRGNGNDDGPMVYTGFKPAFVLYKRSDASGKPWYANDSKRSLHNVVHNTTITSGNDAEQTSSNNTIDFLSNGFKIRKGASSTLNTSGANFIYIAFAERPFKYANAR